MDELNAEQQGLAIEGSGLTGQPEEMQAGDSGQQQGQSFPDFEIKHNGQAVKIPYAQANEYLSKGYDYTAKTQELASQRATLQPYQEMAQYLQANPDKAQAIYGLLTQDLAGQDVDPVQQKVSQLEMTTNRLIHENSMQKLNNMLDTVRNDERYEGLYKDSEMEELLLATALQTGKTNLEDLKAVADKIHKKILGVRVESEKAGEKKAIENLRSPTRQGTPSGAGSYAPPKGFDPSKASWKELSQRAVEML